MSQSLYPRANADYAAGQGVIARRVLAFIIDCFIVTVLFWAAALFIAVFGFFTLGVGWMAFHILPWLPILYYTLLVGVQGASIGQRACGLTVRQDGLPAPPSMAQAFVWALLLWVSLAFAGLPLLLALAPPRHRAAHDLLAGLVITRLPQNSY